MHIGSCPNRTYFVRSDVAQVPDLHSLPGQAPYLRGTRNASGVSSGWEFSQDLRERDRRVYNNALRHALMHGQNSVVLCPNSVSRGLIAGNGAPSADEGELSLLDPAEFGEALEGVLLDQVPVHLATGALAQPLAAAYLAHVKARRVDWAGLRGSLTPDPLGVWMTMGTLPAPLSTCLDALADWVHWAGDHCSHLRTIGVDTTPAHDAGATAAQEIACALAMATDYLRAVAQRGVPATLAASCIRFTLGAGPHFFSEIAKFRAWRVVWSRVLQAFQVAASRRHCTVHARTALWNKSALDPYTNLVRTTTEACAAVLGGIDSLHVGPFDAPTGASGEIARRLARNLHPILSEEFHFADTADPAGGSWYIEHLTDAIGRESWALFQEMERAGGFAAALRAGQPQRMFAQSAATTAAALRTGERVLVGINSYRNPETNAESSAPARTTVLNPSQMRSERVADGLRSQRPAFDELVDAAAKGTRTGEMYAHFNHGIAVHEKIEPLAPLRIVEEIERQDAAAHPPAPEVTGV